MTLATGSKYEASYIAEVDYGVTPNTPAMRKMRVTGDTLKLAKESFLSNELRSDREITDFRHGNRQVAGELNFELSKEAGLEDWMLALLGASAWTAVSYTASTIAFVNGTPDTITDSANGFVTAGFEVGDVITVSDTASNNGTYTITNVAAGTLTVSGTGIADEAAGSATLTAARKYAKVGTAIKSFSYERRFTDVGVYTLMAGLRVNTMNLNVQPNSIITGSFGVLGKAGETTDTSIDATPDAADTNSVMDSFSGAIYEGGSLIGVVTSIEINVNNNLSPAFVVGDDELAAIFEERCNTSGTVVAFLQDETLMQKFEDETITSLKLKLSDGTNFYQIKLPRVKYGDAAAPVSGFGGVTVTMPFQAYRDPSEGASLRIEKSS